MREAYRQVIEEKTGSRERFRQMIEEKTGLRFVEDGKGRYKVVEENAF